MTIKKAKNQIEKTDFVGEMGEDFDKFETWVIEYRKYIIGFCILIIVAVAAVMIGVQIHKSALTKEINTLSGSTTKADLNKNLKIYPEGPYASAARIRLANILAAEKDFAGAAAEFKKAAADDSTMDFIRARSLVNAGYMLEKAGKKDEAVAVYNQASGDIKNMLPIRIEAAFAAGRIYADTGKTELARKNFNFVMKQGVSSDIQSNAICTFWVLQAKNGLAALPQEKVPVKK